MLACVRMCAAGTPLNPRGRLGTCHTVVVAVDKFEPAGIGFHFVRMAQNVTSAISDNNGQCYVFQKISL
jgi:hypothetical protein